MLRALFFTLCSLLSASLAHAQELLKVNVPADDVLNVRVDPHWKSEKVGELQRGATVLAFDEPTNGWLFVRAGTLEGWVNAQYLVPAETMADLRPIQGDMTAEIMPPAAKVEPAPTTEANSDTIPSDLPSVDYDVPVALELEVIDPSNAVSPSIDLAADPATNGQKQDSSPPLLPKNTSMESSGGGASERLTFSQLLWAALGFFVLLAFAGLRAAADEISSELRKPNLVGRMIWEAFKDSSRRR